jgi:6,7-dimethyl-8-ribityllumazine synthase
LPAWQNCLFELAKSVSACFLQRHNLNAFKCEFQLRMETKPKMLVVEARFYDDLSDALLDGATAVLDEAEADFDVVTVMGALEVPAAIAFAVEAGKRGATIYDGFVALGVVIRGATHHFEIVANESSRALMDLSVNHALALGNGILTCETGEQAWERADRSRLDKGGFAAQAALKMIDLRKCFGGLLQ